MYAQLGNNTFRNFDFRIRTASAWVDTEKDVSINFWDKITQIFTIKHLVKKVRLMNIDIEKNVADLALAPITKESKKVYSEIHKSILKLLDTTSFVRNMNVEEITNSNVLELSRELKITFDIFIKFELAIRLKFFPERNEVVLTYDELKELRDCLKGWETAEDQSDVYS